MTKFYIVFSPDGPSAPTLMHPTHKAAAGVAWNMARKFPGQTFHVMATAGKPATASADTRPEGGDCLQAPFTSGAVGAAETPKPTPTSPLHTAEGQGRDADAHPSTPGIRPTATTGAE